MPDGRLLTLRDFQIERANGEYVQAMAAGRILWMELVKDKDIADDVLRYGARALSRGTVRVGIVFSCPDAHGSYFIGADLHVTDVPRWFSVRGVPVVRVSARPPVM